MENKYKFFVSIVLLAVILFAMHTVSAAIQIETGTRANANKPLLLEGGDGIEGQLNVVVGQTAYDASEGSTAQTVVTEIIRYALSFIGVALIVVILYGGYLWMTSAGNEEKISQAKKWIMNGAIGAVIVFVSLSIWIFVIEKIFIASSRSFEEQTLPSWQSGCPAGNSECQEQNPTP